MPTDTSAAGFHPTQRSQRTRDQHSASGSLCFAGGSSDNKRAPQMATRPDSAPKVSCKSLLLHVELPCRDDSTLEGSGCSVPSLMHLFPQPPMLPRPPVSGRRTPLETKGSSPLLPDESREYCNCLVHSWEAALYQTPHAGRTQQGLPADAGATFFIGAPDLGSQRECPMDTMVVASDPLDTGKVERKPAASPQARTERTSVVPPEHKQAPALVLSLSKPRRLNCLEREELLLEPAEARIKSCWVTQDCMASSPKAP
ncbi:hypothetical protein NDU88_002216 [Pleurodeles waltl]|uniref:Uncharacterized protein n=1 Tax=Pleurodeles waltl TaxID=8319 RepID=A0AAV7UUX6_PLEWA|nr:hypothetical protein NDU88_002216 [Pleurodeles waltl]